MKLLLTSTGITNTSLENALKKLINSKKRFAFIPTAANMESGPKDWLIRNFNECEKMGTVDIVDISAIPKNIWLPRLKKANVLVFGGGDTQYLMKCIRKSGLKKELPSLLKTRIYVGISAGSIAAARTIHASSDFIYDSAVKNIPKGLGFVDFNIRPHLNSSHFPKVVDKNLEKVSKNLVGDTYAIDDASGILVDGKNIEIVSDGVWKKYKGK